MKTALRTVSVFLSALLVAAFLFFSLDGLFFVEHECTGADCPICLTLEAGKQFLKMGASPRLAVIFAGALLSSLYSILSGSVTPAVYPTPVSLFDKLSD